MQLYSYASAVFRRIFYCLPLCCAPILGCSYYDASLLDPHAGPTDATSDSYADAADASSESSGDATDDRSDVVTDAGAEGSAEAQACGHVRPPDPPTVSGAGGDIEFVVAVSAIDFGDANGDGDPKQVGYDLDYRCTCQGETNGCMRPDWASAEACDGPDGRDNATGVFISQMTALFGGFGSEAWSEAAIAGEWSIVFKVSGYNGLPDDDQVRLDWYVTDQYWEDKPNGTYVPSWDGTDTWPIRSSCLVDQGAGTHTLSGPKYFDEHAYVSGGRIVASLPVSAFQVSADYAIQFNGAFITAKVVEGSLGWAMQEGLLAARWKLDNILTQVSRINVLGMPVCTDHVAYLSLKRQICAYADMYSGVGAPTTPCDSISTGMIFQTVPARFGEVFEDVLTPAICDPAVDPGNDTCNNL